MKPLIILTGPTAVGKTELSINFAKAIGGEIISADSMQVYKGMDIGTAKITKEEMDNVPHHLIDIMEPDEDFNVMLFKKYASQAIEKIYANNKIPIITGGTGFYIQSVIYNINFEKNDDDDSIRKELEEYATVNGANSLHNILKECDPESAMDIHPNNVKRVIRAIEFYRQTGKMFSVHNSEQRLHTSDFNFIYIVLNDDRANLYKRIDMRVDKMMKDGLLDEVTRLHNQYPDTSLVSMQGLGYKEIISYLKGDCSLDEAVVILKRDTRHFAKRQLTWFRRENNVTWVNKQDFNYDNEVILNHIISLCKTKGII